MSLSQDKLVNINIGILGHVDSGKTSLVRALSTKLSTAALDKHPQSKERGITLDLGFSAFSIPLPEHLKKHEHFQGFDVLQFTLVDCPGHASLIRTIIGGAQIIDRMLLVVDVTKGIQTQTAECLVIGEILTDDLLVVLNKVDLVPEDKREQQIDVVTEIIRKTLSRTRFKSSPILSIAAIVGGDGKAGVGKNTESLQAVNADKQVSTIGLENLLEHLSSTTTIPNRSDSVNAPLYFAVDHCFSMKGQGTVATGTVLSGSLQIGQVVEIPALKQERKIKSMQMFGRPVYQAAMGDRVAVCLTNLDANFLERGVFCTPKSLPPVVAVLALVRKVRYFPLKCESKSKIHITVGHETSLSKVTFFGSNELRELAKESQGKLLPLTVLDCTRQYGYDSELLTGGKLTGGPLLQWAILEFEQPILCQVGGTVIGSRFDIEPDTRNCRIAFYGRVAAVFRSASDLDVMTSQIRIFKIKERVGIVDRIGTKGPLSEDGKVSQVIMRNMFDKGADISRFLGKEVVTDRGERGRIDSSFGGTGKVNVSFPNGAVLSKGNKLFLRFKHFVFVDKATNKKILQ